MKNFRLYKFCYIHTLLVILYCLTQLSCNLEKCKVIEFYTNKVPKLIVCSINGQKVYQDFYEDGSVKTKFHMLNGKLNGECIKYYQSGSIKSKSYYKNGKEYGDFFAFTKDGKIDYYNYLFDDKVIYVKNYNLKAGNGQDLEGFIPIVNFKEDTLISGQSLEFEVLFPLPDSLLKNKQLFFAYEMKPLSLKDSVILFPNNELLLDNKRKLNCTINLSNLGTQIFYGHIINKKEKHIFQSFEKVITVVQKENTG